jgi:hypothetical protein
MRAGFNYLPFIRHGDEIGVSDRGETMGDHFPSNPAYNIGG